MAITIRIFVVPIEDELEESEDELEELDLSIYEKMLILKYISIYIHNSIF
jgi:hypothetical protein